MSVIGTCPICGAKIDNDYPKSYAVIGAFCYCRPRCEEIKIKQGWDEWNERYEANKAREKAAFEAEQARIEAFDREKAESRRKDAETLRQYSQIKAQQQQANAQMAAELETIAKEHGFYSAKDAVDWMNIYHTEDIKVAAQKHKADQDKWEKERVDRSDEEMKAGIYYTEDEVWD